MAAACCSKGSQRFNEPCSLFLYRQELHSVRTRRAFDLNCPSRALVYSGTYGWGSYLHMCSQGRELSISGFVTHYNNWSVLITYVQCLYFTVDKSVVWFNVGRLSRTAIRLQDSHSRSRWPRGFRRGSAAVRLLGVRVWIPPEHGYLSLVNVVSCQVEISATDRSLIQRSPTVCMCVSLSVIRGNSKPLHLEWVGRRG
jgi:hypothetical protein